MTSEGGGRERGEGKGAAGDGSIEAIVRMDRRSSHISNHRLGVGRRSHQKRVGVVHTERPRLARPILRPERRLPRDLRPPRARRRPRLARGVRVRRGRRRKERVAPPREGPPRAPRARRNRRGGGRRGYVRDERGAEVAPARLAAARELRRRLRRRERSPELGEDEGFSSSGVYVFFLWRLSRRRPESPRGGPALVNPLRDDARSRSRSLARGHSPVVVSISLAMMRVRGASRLSSPAVRPRGGGAPLDALRRDGAFFGRPRRVPSGVARRRPRLRVERPFRGRRSLERASRRGQFLALRRDRDRRPRRFLRLRLRVDVGGRLATMMISASLSAHPPIAAPDARLGGVELGGHDGARVEALRPVGLALRHRALAHGEAARGDGPRARRGRGGVLLRREPRGDVPRGAFARLGRGRLLPRGVRARVRVPRRERDGEAAGREPRERERDRGEDDARGDERERPRAEPRPRAAASSRRSASPPSPSGDAGVAAPCSRARSGNRGEPGRRPPSSDLASGFTHRPGRVVGIAPDPAPFASARPMVVRTSNEPSRGVSRAFQSPAGNQSPVGVGVERARVCGEGRLGNGGRP